MTDGLLLPPDGDRRIQTMTLKAGAEQSTIWSAFEAEVAPGFDVGAHLHQQAEEIFYVVEGELDLPARDINPVLRAAPRGGSAYGPGQPAGHAAPAGPVNVSIQ